MNKNKEISIYNLLLGAFTIADLGFKVTEYIVKSFTERIIEIVENDEPEEKV